MEYESSQLLRQVAHTILNWMSVEFSKLVKS